MKREIIKFLASFLLIICCAETFGQSNNDSLIDRSITFEMKDDTLFSNTGLKLFVGQRLIIGKPSGEDGNFRSINHNSAALVPSIWGQDTRYPYAIENHVNKKKSKEKVKKNLVPGNSVVINKIGYLKTGKPYFYAASFLSDTEGFYCDIKLALILKELLL